jgi:phospholipid-binding lipoprotein MlaA
MSANKKGNNYGGVIPKVIRAILLGISVVLSSSCATTEVIDPKNSQQDLAIMSKADPYENFNRKMFKFNDKVDNYVAEPISNVYKKVTPQFVQTGVFNFFNNLKNINVVINDVFQAKFNQSAQDTGRFAMNSTLGLGGLFDVAKHVGLEQNEEDFEQTLAVWGVPQGSYLVLPFLGPSTARGIPGSIFDTAANPTSYVGLPVQLVSLLNTRANAEGSLKFIDEAALDPYVFTRESFLQWRNNLATDGKSQTSTDFDDELLENDIDSSAAPGSKSTTGLNKAADSSLTSAAEPLNKPGFALHLGSTNKEMGQASQSFGTATQSFDETSKSFEDASHKLDKLKKNRKNRLLKSK